MERKNPSHILFSGAREQRFKCACRTQLDIDIFGVRQKTQEQIEAFLERKIIGATFSRIARGDDARSSWQGGQGIGWRYTTADSDRRGEDGSKPSSFSRSTKKK